VKRLPAKRSVLSSLKLCIPTHIPQALDALNQYFTSNSSSPVYIANVELDGNVKSLQTLVAQARKLDKAVYLFSVDLDGEKVAHVNYVPKSMMKSGFDAKTWSNAVTEVLGGRVSCFIPCSHLVVLLIYVQAGGKEESVQGVGVNVDKVQEAVEVAEKTFNSSKH
jgi:alanyl-tRNA synthetase